MTVTTDLQTAVRGTPARVFARISGLNYNLWQTLQIPGELADPPGTSTHPVDADAVGVYRMDETAGSDDAADASGNGYDFTQVNSPPVQSGKFGGARTFEAFDSFQRADASPFQLQAWTFAAWVYPGSGVTNGALWVVDRSGGVGNTSVKFLVASGVLELTLYFTDTSTITLTGTTTVTQQQWGHVCATWDGTTARIYFNGVEEDSDATASGKTIGYTANSVYLGGSAGGLTQWLGGWDDWGFYSTAKSETWIRARGGGAGAFTRQGLNCLRLPTAEHSEALDLKDMVSQASALTLELDDIEDPDTNDGTKFFGKLFAPARWDNGTAGYTWTQKPDIDSQELAVDATTVYVKKTDSYDNDFPSAGEFHIGQETFSYTGKSTHAQTNYTTAVTLGTFTGVTHGLYPAFINPRGGSTTTFGKTYRYPHGADDTPSSTTGHQVVSTVPISWVGRDVGLYITTWDAVNKQWNSEANSLLLWAGTIDSIEYDPSGEVGWRLQCKSLTWQLHERQIGGDGPTAEIHGINLNGNEGREFTLLECNINLAATSVSSYCTVTITAGYHTVASLQYEIQTALNTSGNWTDVSGTHSTSAIFNVNVTGDQVSLHARNNSNILWYVLLPSAIGGTLAYPKWGYSTRTPCHALQALGYDVSGAITVWNDSNGDAEIAAATAPYHHYHPHYAQFNGGVAFVLENQRTLYADQGDYDGSALAHVWAKKANPQGLDSEGPLVVTYTARADSTQIGIAATQLTLAPADRQRKAFPLVPGWQAFIGSQDKNEGAGVQNVLIPEYRDSTPATIGPFTQLLNLLLSTGKQGNYNHATYDVYPVGWGVGFPSGLVDTASFTTADSYVKGRYPELSEREFHAIDQPTSFADLFRREGSLFGIAAVWRQGKLACRILGALEQQDTVGTIDDSVGSDPQAFAPVVADLSQVVNTRSLEYNYNYATEKYEERVVINDRTSMEALGVNSPRAIKHPGVLVFNQPAVIDELRNICEREAMLVRTPNWVVKWTLPPHWVWDIWVGDLVNFNPATGVPDPAGTGNLTCNVAALVLDRTYSYAEMRGTATLLLLTRLDTTTIHPWAPAAVVDISENTGSYTSGWDSTNFYLKLLNTAFGASGDSDDGAALAPAGGEKVIIQARAPVDPTSLAAGEGPFAATTASAYETNGAGVLSLTANPFGASFDATIEYFVTFDDYATAVAAQKTIGSWHADSATELLNSTDRAHRWG